MSEFSKVIAIDGPSGSGKSTIAQIVAEKLNLTYLDTGAMFRGIGYAIDKAGISFSNEDGVCQFLQSMDFQYGKETETLIQINGENLSQKIREHHVSGLASQISQVMLVREFLKNEQRKIASTRPSILEGRDIGSVIFPDAALKFFLTADSRVRAERRFAQLKEKNPNLDPVISVESILKDIEDRDESDSKRKIAPLVKPEGAIEIDTTALSIDEVISQIIQKFNENRNLFE